MIGKRKEDNSGITYRRAADERAFWNMVALRFKSTNRAIVLRCATASGKCPSGTSQLLNPLSDYDYEKQGTDARVGAMGAHVVSARAAGDIPGPEQQVGDPPLLNGTKMALQKPWWHTTVVPLRERTIHLRRRGDRKSDKLLAFVRARPIFPGAYGCE